MPHLFSPIKIKNIEFKNRLVVSPMCEYSSQDGFASDWHLVHLGSRAIGGAALVITEATAVSSEGRITEGDLGIYKDEHIAKLKQVTDFIHRHDSVAGIQLAHAGRKASHQIPWEGGAQIPSDQPGGWKTYAPSALSFTENEEPPVALDKAGIKKVKADFKQAALRAITAGFKVIELHGAHGYLVHEFLTPLVNKRTDSYGGTLEDRARILLEIVAAVREAIGPERALGVRLCGDELIEHGTTIDEATAVDDQEHARLMAKAEAGGVQTTGEAAGS